MAVLSKKGLKKKFKEKGMKIGEDTIKKFINIEESKIQQDIEKAIRNAKLSGRKVIKEEDLEDL